MWRAMASVYMWHISPNQSLQSSGGVLQWWQYCIARFLCVWLSCDHFLTTVIHVHMVVSLSCSEVCIVSESTQCIFRKRITCFLLHTSLQALLVHYCGAVGSLRLQHGHLAVKLALEKSYAGYLGNLKHAQIVCTSESFFSSQHKSSE